MDLKGAVALVTGSNGGLGQRICYALAAQPRRPPREVPRRGTLSKRARFSGSAQGAVSQTQ